MPDVVELRQEPFRSLNVPSDLKPHGRPSGLVQLGGLLLLRRS
jgi:hypothetical protein